MGLSLTGDEPEVVAALSEAHRLRLLAVVANEGNRQQALSLCLLQRLQDIWGIAAGGNAHSDVLGLTVGLSLIHI